MTGIFIVAENVDYRRKVAAVLRASGRHVATTSDMTLLLSAIHITSRPLIMLLSELAANQLDTYLGACESRDLEYQVSASSFIILTKLPPDAGPDRVRAFARLTSATFLDPNCSLAALLTAVLQAEEQLASAAFPDTDLTAPELHHAYA